MEQSQELRWRVVSVFPGKSPAAFFVGRVMHGRSVPVQHSFEYPVVYLACDIERLDEIGKQGRLFSHNTRNILSLHDRDYLDGRALPIRQKLEEYVTRFGEKLPDGKIILVTVPRYFGYVFNPVSFYFCYDRGGVVRLHVAEINNTYGERHLYLLGGKTVPPKLSGGEGTTTSYVARKDFFVSPFNHVTGDYEFHFEPLGAKYDVRLHIRDKGKIVFVSRVWGEQRSLTTTDQVALLLRYPLNLALAIPRIYWQAQRLRFQRKLPMFDKPAPVSERTIKINPPTLLDRLGMVVARRFLGSLSSGAVELKWPDGRHETLGNLSSPMRSSLEIREYRTFRRLLIDGGIGFGEGYQAGEWTSGDLPTLLKIIISGMDQKAERKLNLLTPFRWLNRWRHRRRGNTIRNSKVNISEHYDLSNRFFGIILDPSMTYSSAIFDHGDEDLERAQLRKVRKILDKALVRRGDHILEIGSGWGTLAIVAAQEYGARVTTLTLSEAQRALAIERIKAAGLEGQIAVEFCDYRHISGTYDAVVSVEMMEAIGHEYLPDFFRQIERVLKPEGIAVVQVITMLDSWYDEYRTRQDWIQKHIFPGSHLPSLTAIANAATGASDLLVEHVENFASHYAMTLRRWRETMLARRADVMTEGRDERFVRTFEFYFASCEAEFETRMLGLHQIVFTRPGNPRLLAEDKEWRARQGAHLSVVKAG